MFARFCHLIHRFLSQFFPFSAQISMIGECQGWLNASLPPRKICLWLQLAALQKYQCQEELQTTYFHPFRYSVPLPLYNMQSIPTISTSVTLSLRRKRYIKALTSSEKPLILLRPWECNESRKHLVSSCPLSGRYLTGFCSESYNFEINNRRAGQEYLTFTNLGCVNKVNKYLQSS